MKKIFKRLFCSHKNAKPIGKYTHYIDGSMRKVDVVEWRCPDCDKEWKQAIY